MGTDEEWEKWGKQDPYFAVITADKYRSSNMTDEARKEFFQSGRNHVQRVLDMCRRRLDDGFAPRRALDFGCGTGRILLPLAEIAEDVVGLDVSRSMLDEAAKNCRSSKNITLLLSDDSLSSLSGKFDFIHSYIVLQHIPVERGRRIFERLLDFLEDGGVCAIHFTFAKECYRENYGAPEEKDKKRLKISLRSLFRTPTNNYSQDPEMQMNSYRINDMLFLVQSSGIRRTHLEFTNHGGEHGVFLFLQKPEAGKTDDRLF